MYVYTILETSWLETCSGFNKNSFLKVDHSNHLYCGKITLPSCLVWENKITRGLDLVPQSKEGHSSSVPHGAYFSFWKVISSLLNSSWPVNVCLFLFYFLPLFLAILYPWLKMYIPMCNKASFRTFIDEDKDKMNLEEEVKKGSIL